MSSNGEGPDVTNHRSDAELANDRRAKWMAIFVKAFLFLDGCTHNGLTHVVNVYLVALQGWTPFDASWIWFTRDMVKFILKLYAKRYVGALECRRKSTTRVLTCWLTLT